MPDDDIVLAQVNAARSALGKPLLSREDLAGKSLTELLGVDGMFSVGTVIFVQPEVATKLGNVWGQSSSLLGSTHLPAELAAHVGAR